MNVSQIGTIFDPQVLAGKRILVTGGGTGLGRGVSRHLVQHGAQVHIWGRREAVLQEAVQEISDGHPGSAHLQTVDVRDAAAVQAAVDEIWSEHGPLTGLINNAAANFIAQTKDISANAFRAITSTVMDGSFHTTHALGKRWIAEGLPGSVISTLTTWMTMSLAAEWGRYNIRLNAIAPGPIPTEYAWSMLNPTEKSSTGGSTSADNVPMQRFGTMEELANLNIFLLSNACPYLTGVTIAMDGGQQLAGPGTLASLNAMTEEDWAEARATAKAASEASKAQRTV
jgi:NAD(P)-dependent dehydrogenase (short-subunit alcohol dehydrogenase family)